MSKSIELVLFSNDPKMVSKADQAGIDYFIIDIEKRTTESRSQIAGDSNQSDHIEDIKAIAKVTNNQIWCRINQLGKQSPQEIKSAIEYGAGLILLPMVKTVQEVEDFLALVNNKVKTGILIETTEACEIADKLAKLPLNNIYVGLLDLSISRNCHDIFAPLIDGTVEKLRKTFINFYFGVGGLTTIDAGSPLPCLQLMNHLTRLNCDFTFLRNSFKKDIQGKNMAQEVTAIKQAWEKLSTSHVN